MRFETVVLVLVLRLGIESAFAQTVQDRLKVLEAEIQRLQQEVENLKRETDVSQPALKDRSPSESPAETRNPKFSDQILVPDLGGDTARASVRRTTGDISPKPVFQGSRARN